MTLYALSEPSDLESIRRFLERDIHFSAYALGDLDAPYADRAHWYTALQDDAIVGLILVYGGLNPPAVFLMGDLAAVCALLLTGITPNSIFYSAKPEAERLLAQFYKLERVDAMYRMRITKGTFRPIDNLMLQDGKIISLGPDHLNEVMTFIQESARADGRNFADLPFAPEMLDDGYYRGVTNKGKLVAIGGTHVVAREASMAAVGNIVVHPDFRRKGIGSAITQAVTQGLVDDNLDLIVLNVRQNNTGALKIYRRLGYKQVCAFIEGPATR